MQNIEQLLARCAQDATQRFGLSRITFFIRFGRASRAEGGIKCDVLGDFDHAIVHVPGDEPLWIDATNRFARVGELPTADQGRLCLLVAPGTDRLIVSPVSTPQDNLDLETREFFLPETGAARVVETSLAHGSAERDYRSAYYGIEDS